MIIFRAHFEKIKRLKTKVEYIFSAKHEEVEGIDPILFLQIIESTGYLAFNGDYFKKVVENAMKDRSIGIDETGKSKSQRLRGVLFQIALKDGLDGDTFYDEELEKIINHYKDKYL